MTIEWQVPLGQARAISMALQSLSADTRAARGCTGCSVSTELANGVTLRYVEDWQTEEDLRDHLRSDVFGRVIALVEAAIQPPRVEFMLPQGTRGLDYIAEVRRSVG
jgi:quinol monooxygenase YgiN